LSNASKHGLKSGFMHIEGLGWGLPVGVCWIPVGGCRIPVGVCWIQGDFRCDLPDSRWF